MGAVVAAAGEALAAGQAAVAVVVGVRLLVLQQVGPPAERLLAEQTLVGLDACRGTVRVRTDTCGSEQTLVGVWYPPYFTPRYHCKPLLNLV